MGIFREMNGTEMVFWATAILGTAFFALRVLMMIVGGFGDDVAADTMNADSDTGAADTHHDGTDTSFKLVSMNSITGFIMMFGWAGLAAYVQYQLNASLSFFIAFIVGLFCMFITAYLFKLAMKLNSPGARFDILQTVGTTGEVYLRVPASGTGKVKVTIDDTTRIVDAVAENKQEIDSFKKVSIVRVIDSETISVKEI